MGVGRAPLARPNLTVERGMANNSTFNRPAPPQFRGFDANGTFTSYSRNLPHWRQPGATYFVTFRLVDSLPQEVLDYLKRLRDEFEKQPHHPALREEYEKRSRTVLESSLDEGHGCCILNDPENVRIVKERFEHGLGTQHFAGCGVVMPNHVHVVIRPLEGFELAEILRQVKGFSAKMINSRIGRRGALWQDESYDRIIRDEEHLYRVMQYIGRNPTQCGITPPDLIRWVHPDWIAAGWTFEDRLRPSTG